MDKEKELKKLREQREFLRKFFQDYIRLYDIKISSLEKAKSDF